MNQKLKGPNHNFRDSADVGDGGAGIGPVTYTPFPDPPVSSPGEILLFIKCVQTTILGIEREKAFKICRQTKKEAHKPGCRVSCCALVNLWSEREMLAKQMKGV